MILHENRLPADDSHIIPCLICYFKKVAKFSHVLGQIKFVLAFFVKGHLKTISAKSMSVLKTGFREEDVKCFLQRSFMETGHVPWRPCC